MKFILEINCDNAAFGDEPEVELGRLISDIAYNIERGLLDEGEGKIRDINGSTVGRWEVVDE